MKHFFLLSNLKRSEKIDPGKGPVPSEEIPETLYDYEHDVNTSDGGEFIDDNLRMKDQPLGEAILDITSPNSKDKQDSNR